MDLELIYDVAKAAATNQGWKFTAEVTMFEEKRWPFGAPVAWRVEFARTDREAIGFVRVDARSFEVIATGWRADPRTLRRPHNLEAALLEAAA